MVCFSSDRHGEGGAVVFLLWWQEKPALPLPFLIEVGSVAQLSLEYIKSNHVSVSSTFLLHYTVVWISNTRNTSELEVRAPPCYILWVLQIAVLLASLIVDPLIASSFSFCFRLLSLWTVTTDKLANNKVSEESYQQHLSQFPVFFPIFITERRWKNELNAHSVPLSLAHRSAFIFFLLSEEEWQASVGSQLRNFTGSTVRALNLQPGVCFRHTLSHSVS